MAWQRANAQSSLGLTVCGGGLVAIESNERCVLCREQAVVRVRGTSFCASCGLSQYEIGGAESPTTRRSRRAIVAFFTSGIFIKGLLGAVAVAAVGGAAATSVRDDPTAASAAPETTAVTRVVPTTVEPPVEPPVERAAIVSITKTTVGPPAQLEIVDAVARYVVAVEAWADCVSETEAQSTEAFDPEQECPGKPEPGDSGLAGGSGDDPDTAATEAGDVEDGPGNSEDAPGHDEDGPGNSEDAPGHVEDGPGNSEDAPGHDEDGPGNSEEAPGNRGDTGMEA